MNWDRVRQWDRVRDGMSDMELADERDDRWFAREAEREQAREQRAADRRSTNSAGYAAKPTPPKKEPAKTAKAPAGKNLKPAAVAQRLGIPTSLVQAAIDAQTAASTGLGGLAKNERQRTAARRLGVTPDELRMLRRALAGNPDALDKRERIAGLIRTAAAHQGSAPPAPAPTPPPATGRKTPRGVITSQSAPATAAPPPRTPSAPTPQRAKMPKQKPSAKGPKPPDPKDQAMVYVTTWGNVVHLFHDCHSARGFRNANDRDPDLYRVPVQDPSCRGRRVCGTCRQVTFANAKKVDDQLRRFHGKPFDESEWKKQGWFRPKPSGKPIGKR